MHDDLRRRPGRPPLSLSGPAESMSLRVDPLTHDEACRRALAEGRSVADVLRRALRRGLGLEHRPSPSPER
jgi:hypothetical protein